MTLQKETRDAIGRTVRSLRELFEGEFGKQASGRFGIRSSPREAEPDGSQLDAWLDPVESLSLTPAEFAQRNELIHALRYLTSEGNGPSEAVARLIREAAFTAVNRLLAIRVAEAIGALPPVLASGRQSAGFRDTVGDLFPVLAHDEDSYWNYIQVAGDELSPGVPRLFDRRHPTSTFVPARSCVEGALELLAASELDAAWGEPEVLGWGYQYFNGDDVSQMRSESQAPRNSRELAVRNQFFTPGYVVDWLVQNTLGRRLVQAGYEVNLPLLVGEISVYKPLALEDVRVLDPAVGSGHFLLGSYDLLEQAWQSTGVPPNRAAALILPCLFGVDIDPRAAQVAQAVLQLRARRSTSSADLVPPTVVTAVALPHSKMLREQAFADLSPAARHLADDLTEALDQAPQLGSLLKIEQRLGAELASHRAEPRLAVDGSEANVLDELRKALGDLVSVAASPEQRIFTAEATDALRFVEICQQSYDAVLMNPPFGDAVKDASRKYLQSTYPDWWTELYACFLTRAFELLRDHGSVGMLSSSQFLITRRMRELRELLACDWPPVSVIDLGSGVLSGATVNTVISVYTKDRIDYSLQYRDLSKVSPMARESLVTYATPEDFRTLDIRQFKTLDRTPFAFHVPDAILELWRYEERLDPSLAEVRTGQTTFDNFRFLRLWWELPVSCQEEGWRRYQKGGEFKTYVEPSHLMIDWRADGLEMREFAEATHGTSAQTLQSSSHWGRWGLTSPNASSVGFGARVLSEGEVFANKAVCIFPHRKRDVLALLGVLNSTVFAEVVRVFGRTRATENGAIKAMPIGPSILSSARGDAVDEAVEGICEELYRWEVRDETSPFFCSPFACEGPRTVEEAHVVLKESADLLSVLQLRIDEAVARALGVDAEQVIDPDVTRRPELITGCLPWSEQSAGARWAADVASWAVGVAWGRWNPEAAPPEFSTDLLLSGVPKSPLRQSGSSPISLLASQGTDSLSARVEAIVGGVDPALPTSLARSLGASSLGEWLEAKFFGNHLQRYSRSRRYSPIYWQLTVPSKRWGLWLYAPSLSRETLFAVAHAGREKVSRLNEQVRLAHERVEFDREARERVESLEDLAAEVEKFSAVADEAAQSGWEPDLNDGCVLNAAPLEELFVNKRWRGEVAKHRKAMQKGDYPWATVQREYFERRT